LLTPEQISKRLNSLTKEEIVGLFTETLKSNIAAHAFVCVKLEGETAFNEALEHYKKIIRVQFFPSRGHPKLNIAVVKKAIAEMNQIATGTIWTLELMVFFCETASRYIGEEADIDEDMGDYFTDMFQEAIDRLNREKTLEQYEKYKDRLKAIVNMKNCECWGIHDLLEDYFAMLKWDVGDMAQDYESPEGISYAALRKWSEIPEQTQQLLIQNVWCGKCLNTASIKDFNLQLHTYGIILKGTCTNCGHQVARFIED
jgi:hypothetical protein